jgi:hypothetical protein
LKRTVRECNAPAREFQGAWQADHLEMRARFKETAAAADRDPRAFLLHWVTSRARMPDDEFDALQGMRYPRVAEVRRRWSEHEARSGHAALGDSWRSAFILNAAMRSGYGGFSSSDP